MWSIRGSAGSLPCAARHSASVRRGCLLDRAGAGSGFSRGRGSVVPRAGGTGRAGDLRRLYSNDSDVDERGFGWIIDTRAGASLLEVSSAAGAKSQTLANLSKGGGQVASFVWIAASGTHQLSFTENGEVWSTSELDGDPISDLRDAPPQLRRLVDALAADVVRFGPVAVGLAALDLWSGQRLDDDILDSSWPTVSFAAIPKVDVPRPETIFGHRETELALAVDAASPERFLAAQTQADDRQWRELRAELLKVNATARPAGITTVERL